MPEGSSSAKKAIGPKPSIFLQRRQQVCNNEWSSLVAPSKRRVGDPTYTCFRRTGRCPVLIGNLTFKRIRTTGLRPVVDRQPGYFENYVNVIGHNRACNEIVLIAIAVSYRLIHDCCNLRLAQPKRTACCAAQQSVNLFEIIPTVVPEWSRHLFIILHRSHPLLFLFPLKLQFLQHRRRDRHRQPKDDVIYFTFRLVMRQMTTVVWYWPVHVLNTG